MKLFPFLFSLVLTASVLFAQEENAGKPSPAPGSATPPDAGGGFVTAVASAVASAVAPPVGGIPTEKEAGEGTELDFIVRSNFIFSKLMKNTRAMDPFGQQMDPANAKETTMLSEQYAEVEETPGLNNSSLKSALMTLPITGVYPQRNVIVIGARSFPRGGQFGMKLQELTIRLRFEGVRGKEIFFKDMETQEVTSIEFNPRPEEFEPLTNTGPQPPGTGIVSMKELFIAN